MPKFDRPRSIENQILAENAQYPSPPPNTDPAIARKFTEIAHSVAASHWRSRAEVGQLLTLAATELLLEKLTRDVLRLSSFTLDAKVHPLLHAYHRTVSVTSLLRSTLGLTTQSASSIGLLRT